MLKLKKPAESREELAVAETCYNWARRSLKEMGVPELYDEIVAFETKEEAEATQNDAYAAFKRQDMAACLELFVRSQSLFERAGEAKTVKDMDGVVTYLHQVEILTQVPALAAASKAEEIISTLTGARPCIVTLASLRSTGLRKWTGTASVALEHVDISIKFCKLFAAFEAKFRANVRSCASFHLPSSTAPTNRRIDKSTNRRESFKHSITQSLNHSFNQSLNHSITR